LIVKISSSLSTAIVDCGIYSKFSNWQIKVYLTLTAKLNLVKFYSGTSTQTPRSAPTGSAIQLLVETYQKDMHRQNVR